MPTCLSTKLNFSPKSFKLTLLVLFSPLFFFGQSLTGLWTGALSNDSSTVRKDQSFEIALTEYRGKVYGYSRSEFIVNDTLYYVVKRVKGVIDGDVCEVTDDEIIAYNFRGKLDKGIKVTSTFRKNQGDSSWYLAGTWKTNATKKYYSVSGKVDLGEEKDLAASKLFPHLEELNLAKDVAFYQERKDEPSIVRTVKPEKIKTEYSTKTISLPDNSDIAVNRPELQRADARPLPAAIIPATETAVVKIGEETSKEDETEIRKDKVAAIEVPKSEIKKIESSSVNVTGTKPMLTRADNKNIPVAIDESKKTTSTTDIAKNEIVSTNTSNTLTKIENSPVPSSESKKPAVISNITKKAPVSTNINTKPAIKQNEPVSKSTPAASPPSTQEIKNKVATQKPIVVSTAPKSEPAATNTSALAHNTGPSIIPIEEKQAFVDILVKTSTIAGRKSEFSQVVSFKSDSLELSLYDNGEIDGDTVSVFLNGEVILSKQGLKASAIKKTIYITPQNEDFTLVLFAENLGKYPPNTGLLVVHDGEDVYNLRFSSDFKKNAGIVFRRKK
jgi:hypothetical protein